MARRRRPTVPAPAVEPHNEVLATVLAAAIVLALFAVVVYMAANP